MSWSVASMKVLVHGETAAGSLASYLTRALRAVGHQAELFDATRHDAHVPLLVRARYKLALLRPAAAHAANRRFVRRVERERPDLVVVVKGTHLEAQSIRRARAACGAIVNVFPDGVTEAHAPGILAGFPAYARVFVKEPYLLRRLRAAGFENARYLPQCCDPATHHPALLTADEATRFGADVALVGSAYPYRIALLSALDVSALQARVWGRGWEEAAARLGWCSGAEVVELNQAKVFAATRVNLNTAHLQDVEGVNKRTFEIAGSGGFQLAPEQADLPNLFEPGREIVTYAGVEDLNAKVRYFLARPDERSEIGAAACRRAHRDHTYAQRVEAILAEAVR